MEKIFIIGNLTKDPEIIELQDKNLTKITVAVNSAYKNKNGEQNTNYYFVMLWGKLGENCAKYCKKGDKVSIQGTPNQRKYEKDGITQHIFEIIASEIEFLSSKNINNEQQKINDLEPIDDNSLPF